MVLELSKIQSRSGWRPAIFTSSALTDVMSERIDGVPVRRFAYTYPYFGLTSADREAMDQKGGNLVSVPLMSALLHERNVRLFHAHAIKRLGGQVRLAARMTRRPYVVSLHGGVFDVPPSERQQPALERKSTVLEWGKLLGAAVGSRRVLDDADHVICVGRGEYDLARQNIPHDRISYMPNAVHPEKFKVGNGAAFRKAHGLPREATLILNVGRIDRQKNQKLLLEAFARLRSRRQDVFLVFVGPITQPDYNEELRAFATANGLDAAVRFLPAIEYDSPLLADVYHACDMFVLPSIHEPFGIVVLEAWSSGKPVIVSRVGGLKSLVDEGRTGLFLDPERPGAADDLAAVCERVSNEREMAGALGAAGRDAVLQRYTWEVVGRGLEEVYRAAEERAKTVYRDS